MLDQPLALGDIGGRGLLVIELVQLAIQKDAYPRIRTVALADPSVSRTLVLVKRKTAALSPAAQTLYDLILKKA